MSDFFGRNVIPIFVTCLLLLCPTSAGATYVRITDSPYCLIHEVVDNPEKPVYITYAFRPNNPGFSIPLLQLKISFREGSSDLGGPGGLARGGLVQEATLIKVKDTITFLPQRLGSVEVCFVPSMTHFPNILQTFFGTATKSGVFLEVILSVRGSNSESGLMVPGTDTVPTVEIDRTHASCHYATVLLKDIRISITQFQRRLNTMRATSESTFSRVWMMDLLTVVVAAVLCVAQYISLTRFLKQRKLV